MPSPIPLYHQLAEVMGQLIRRGTLQAWDQLPSEQFVADHFHVSRPTVRQAWQELERRRLIIRDHGKGTFVNGRTDSPVPTTDNSDEIG